MLKNTRLDIQHQEGDIVEVDNVKPIMNGKKKSPDTWLKYTSLIILVIQNAGQVLLIRYATTRSQKPFLKTVLVFFSEILKCVVACLLLWASHRSLKKTLADLRAHFIDNFIDTIKVSVPALIYTIQNFLLYVSIENLDAGTYMVTYQLKTLTTALFTVVMLKRRLSFFQWIALVILCGGVAIVQISASKRASNVSSKANDSLIAVYENNTLMGLSNETFVSHNISSSLRNMTTSHTSTHQNSMLGFGAVLLACFLSGFAGIYFEKILKGSDTSLWLRNVQLASLSIPIGIVMIALSNGHDVLENGLLQGFDAVIWTCVCMQALGGLIVAVVIKYADNILKAFATSFAIIVSSIASILLFEHYPTLLFNAGAVLVIMAVVIYSAFPYKASNATTNVKNDRKFIALERLSDGNTRNDEKKCTNADYIDVTTPLNAATNQDKVNENSEVVQ